jgi:hypothetical chaperone protein
MMTRPCGLDFGTSNSTFSTLGADGLPCLLPVEAGSPTIPTVVFFSFEADRTDFGRAALAEYVGGGEGRLLRSIKSVLGTTLMNDTTRVGNRKVAFTEILGLFVAELKTRAEASLGESLDSIVVGRPVHFVDDDAVADAQAQGQLEAAVRAQGFRHVAFQYEPIAAALDYERQVTRERLALIVDLGGGTADFSVVRVSPERARCTERQDDILATAGVHVGGTDFDRLLSMARIMPLMGLGTPTADAKRFLPVAPYYDLATWHRINRLYTEKTVLDLESTIREAARPRLVQKLLAVVEDRHGHRLASAVEAAKIALSDVDAVPFTFATRAGALAATITVAELTAALAGAVERIEGTITRTLAGAGVGTADIDSLILTGGSTLVPTIVARLQALFPDAEFVRTDVFGSVGLGLAMDAARRL